MKIMISNDGPFAHYYIRMSWLKVLSAMGHDAVLWDINRKTTFDAFNEFEPDLFIGQTYNINDALIACLSKRPHLRVIMKASDWGTYSDTIDREKFPVLIASEQEIDNVRKLRENDSLDYVFVHYLQKHVDETHKHWMDIVPAKSMLSAADVFDFTNGKSKPEYECDLGFLGGRWGYKSRTLDPYLLPLCRDASIKFKIFGNQSWGIPQYCGYLPDEEVRHFLASATICPNISEPHSQEYGYDIVERPYKLAANKCFVISDYVEGLKDVYPDMPMCSTPETFKDQVHHFLKDEEHRTHIVEENYKETINHHTYFHRIAEMFGNLGMEEEVKRCMEVYLGEIKRGLNL